MAARSSDSRHTDRHDWNRYEAYQRINERKLAEYPFIEDIDLSFEEIDSEGELFVLMEATIWLPKSVVLAVTKFFETTRRGAGRGRLYVRCLLYRYNAWIEGNHNILGYDNGHDPDEYHGHKFDPDTGEEVEHWSMSRNEFPLFSEVIDELDVIMHFTETA